MPLDGALTLPLSFPLEPAEEDFQLRFRSWLEAHVPRDAPPVGRRELMDHRRAWQRTLWENGWAGVTWPEEYGGLGATPMLQYLYYEELVQANAPETANRPGLTLIGPTLIAHATPVVKERYLPRILAAEDVWCQAFSEADAGSDLAGLTTTATLDGDEFRIEGHKTWTTQGDLADHCAVLVRTGDRRLRHRTLSLLLVELDQPGIEVRPITLATGETELSEIFFDGATTPADHVVGTVDGGWAAAMTMLEFERSDRSFTDHGPVFARIGQLRADMHAASASIEQRVVADLWERLGDAWVRAHALREMNLSIVLRRQQGEAIGATASPSKVFYAQLSQDIERIRFDLADLTGPLEARHLGAYLTSRMNTVHAGTIDVQRSIIAERILGLPRPPRPIDSPKEPSR